MKNIKLLIILCLFATTNLFSQENIQNVAADGVSSKNSRIEFTEGMTIVPSVNQNVFFLELEANSLSEIGKAPIFITVNDEYQFTLDSNSKPVFKADTDFVTLRYIYTINTEQDLTFLKKINVVETQDSAANEESKKFMIGH